MLGKIRTVQQETRDKLVIINENGTADIADVYDRDHEKITADSITGDYTVPLADIKAYSSSRGIIYVYPSTQENIEDCQRLAALEKSIVLRQVTQYEKIIDPNDEKTDFTKIFLYILIVILVIVVAVK